MDLRRSHPHSDRPLERFLRHLKIPFRGFACARPQVGNLLSTLGLCIKFSFSSNWTAIFSWSFSYEVSRRRICRHPRR
jgi:hypothetical protein